MTCFRPCIDLHNGKVKQIVGSSLTDEADSLETNYISDQPAHYYADLYRRDGLQGGHLIQLGPGNQEVALSALSAYPGGLQVGGGIHLENSVEWLEAGASHVIVTSYLFDDEGHFLRNHLESLSVKVGRDQLVVDLSCRRTEDAGWRVTMNRWQTSTDLLLDANCLSEISKYCVEFLVHAADVEGKCEGIDSDLVAFLGLHSPIPVTYAGGARSIEDLSRVKELSQGRVDVTIGSALDLFGGSGVRYADCVAWNRSKR